MSTNSPKVRSIFLAAVENVEPNHWPAFLEIQCEGDLELRRQVETLLQAHQQANSLFGEPPVATVDEPHRDRPDTTIDHYRLVEESGEGGMGTGWMAQQTEPVKRLVAVKLIKAGMDSKQVLARFDQERQALALMDHPSIAKVHDAGSTPDGRPFFVMELVKGVPITRD